MNATIAILSRMGIFISAFAAGVAFVLQQAVNSSLRTSLGSVAWAGFASYLGGTLCMAALAMAMGEAIPGARGLTGAPWWSWTGGMSARSTSPPRSCSFPGLA